jgi:hypothetical protein
MPEAKKGVARIPVPQRNHPKPEGPLGDDGVSADERPERSSSTGSAQMMMSAGAQGKRDPWTVPLIGLLLAFSVISLILQMLIAFS